MQIAHQPQSGEIHRLLETRGIERICGRLEDRHQRSKVFAGEAEILDFVQQREQLARLLDRSTVPDPQKSIGIALRTLEQGAFGLERIGRLRRRGDGQRGHQHRGERHDHLVDGERWSQHECHTLRERRTGGIRSITDDSTRAIREAFSHQSTLLRRRSHMQRPDYLLDELRAWWTQGHPVPA